MSDEADPRFRHDPDTVRLGYEQIAEIRTRLGQSSTAPSGTDSSPRESIAAERSEATTELGAGTDQLSADRMTAEMAAGAERDLLAARVAQLEVEVARLRAALSQVLRAAAAGLEVDDVAESDPDRAHP